MQLYLLIPNSIDLLVEGIACTLCASVYEHGAPQPCRSAEWYKVLQGPLRNHRTPRHERPDYCQR